VIEREVLLTGIGGQGVQLAAQVLARAALAEGRDVQMFGSYGGMMRGGNTEATVIVADGPVESPPTVSGGWSALVMHHEHFEAVHARLRRGAVVLVNSTVFDGQVDPDRFVVVDVPATALAVSATGQAISASMVLLGAYGAATGLVGLEALSAAVAESLPPYRSRHVGTNVMALQAGYAAVPKPVVDAWAAGAGGGYAEAGLAEVVPPVELPLELPVELPVKLPVELPVELREGP
jgi:Pyruvate/2-oxoacid:ferredoxin oxidoreductase gamma subunit